MMWSDKAFGIWMGHAGEDTQVYTQDDASIDVKAFERLVEGYSSRRWRLVEPDRDADASGR